MLLSIRWKLTVQYCFKVDHVLKFLNFCTRFFLLVLERLNLKKYKSSKTSKHDQLWNSIVQSVFIWLIKAKRDFNELDQLYRLYEKKSFFDRARMSSTRNACENQKFQSTQDWLQIEIFQNYNQISIAKSRHLCKSFKILFNFQQYSKRINFFEYLLNLSSSISLLTKILTTSYCQISRSNTIKMIIKTRNVFAASVAAYVLCLID